MNCFSVVSLLFADRGISDTGDFAGVAAVFMQDEATVEIFAPFDNFGALLFLLGAKAVYELLFVVEDLEIAVNLARELFEV